jgi:hypothetical protein
MVKGHVGLREMPGVLGKPVRGTGQDHNVPVGRILPVERVLFVEDVAFLFGERSFSADRLDKRGDATGLLAGSVLRPAVGNMINSKFAKAGSVS